MLQQLKSAHFQINYNVKDRSLRDDMITPSVLKTRGFTFEILESLAGKVHRPKLISSCYGSFDRILLTMPYWLFLDPPASKDAYLDVYSDLVKKLPNVTNFVVLTNEVSKDHCQLWADENGIGARTLIGAARDAVKFSIWAEDAYCIAEDQEDSITYFVESAAFDRYDDEFIADEIVKFTDYKLSLANVYFQGGNVLIGDDYWLIGLDYPNNSFDLGYIKQQPNETKLEATRRAYGTLMDQGRTLHPIGTHLPVPEEKKIPQYIDGTLWNHMVYRGNRKGTTQPLFHIDMFVTLLGQTDEGQQLVMVADPSMASETLGDLDFVRFAKQFSMQSAFDDIAKRFADLGFKVMRNPLPSAYYADARKREIGWYFATPNNALVQITSGSKDIWVPQYGFGDFKELEATDKQTREILEGLGFTVHPLGDFHPFAAGLGAVHCIKKYLARS